MTDQLTNLPLSDQIAVSGSYLRAANVELTADATLADYLPTARGLDVVRRVVASLERGSGKAWSITGPYGTGKSSFALFLAALLGEPKSPRRLQAFELLREADADLAVRLTDAVSAIPMSDDGFVTAVVTADREPVLQTLRRALEVGIGRRWVTPPSDVSRALDGIRSELTAAGLKDLVDVLASRTPVLMLIDEFGKNLEHFATEQDAGDLFILQSIAEAASSSDRCPVLFFTLQHLAFDDYARSSDVTQRREWGKVQGRFEDVTFMETSEDVTRLIAKALDDRQAGPKFRKARREWAEAALPQLHELGLASHFADGVDSLEACYPLHPLTVLALPELCARFGQHGRTLLSFLAGRSAGSLGEYLETARWGSKHLPTVGLEDVYDFFVTSANQQVQASAGASRWAEVDARIRDSSALTADQVELLKVVGVLNLVSQSGVIRASSAMVSLALSGECQFNGSTDARVRTLVERGTLTYRKFADEYRLWQGSDFDIRGAVEAERARMEGRSFSAMLASLMETRHVVAGRHSQRVGMLRYFETTYVDGQENIGVAGDTTTDGWLGYYLGDASSVRSLILNGDRPAVLLAAVDVAPLRELIADAVATLAVQELPELETDWVARREIAERVGQLRRQVGETLTATFQPDAPGVSAYLFHSGRVESLATDGVRSISTVLSTVCDEIYRSSPIIQNEMLARRELSSQGARARRELMTAMIERASESQLGIDGYGPDRAMYEAFLKGTGLHAPIAKDKSSREFRAPHKKNALWPAYGALMSALDATSEEPRTAQELFALLKRPPYGVTDGPLPVLLLACLIQRSEDVAIFQDGTFLPELSADVAERLVKTPGRFTLKHFPVSGGRLRVLEALQRELAPAGNPASYRNAGILTALGPILRLVRRLPDAVRYDDRLTPYATAVREALLDARQPDDLLFRSLPVACALDPVTSATGPDLVALFVDRLRDAVRELETAYPSMLVWIGDELSAALGSTGELSELRADMQAVGREIGDKVLDQRLRAFLHLAANEGLDDESWLEALGLSLSDKPPATWRPTDRARFASSLLQATSTIRRVQALHFESLVEPMEGFIAQRHTVTHSDGTEEGLLLAADESAVAAARGDAADIIDTYMTRGRHELNALMLAMWAELNQRALSPGPVIISRSRDQQATEATPHNERHA